MTTRTPARRALRILRNLVLALVALVALLAALARPYARSRLFRPTAEGDWAHEKARHPIEDVRFDSSDGTRLLAWYLHTDAARATLLFFHGNAKNITNQLRTIDDLGDAGLDVFIVDYRGYGRSEGTPDETGIYLDADASYRYLTGTRAVAADKLYVLGVSLGGAPAIDVALHHPNAGLIIQSSFASVASMAKRQFKVTLPDFLVPIRFDNLERISQVHSPKLFFATHADTIVPYEQTRALYEASSEPRTWIEYGDCGHNDLHKVHEREWSAAIRKFTGG